MRRRTRWLAAAAFLCSLSARRFAAFVATSALVSAQVVLASPLRGSRAYRESLARGRAFAGVLEQIARGTWGLGPGLRRAEPPTPSLCAAPTMRLALRGPGRVALAVAVCLAGHPAPTMLALRPMAFP